MSVRPFAYLAILLSHLLALGEGDRRIEQLLFEYEIQVEEVSKSTRQQKQILFQKYADAVEKLQTAHQEAGDLENTIEAKEEIRLAREKGEIGKTDFKGIAPLRKTLLDAMKGIDSRFEANVSSVADQYLDRAKQLQINLTKEGKIDAALKLGDVIKRFENSPAALSPGGDSGSEPSSANLASGGKPELNTVYKNWTGIESCFPLTFDLSGWGSEDLKRANGTLKEKVENAVARWSINVQSINETNLYGNSNVIHCAPGRVEIGGVSMAAEVRVFFADLSTLSSRQKGNTVEIAGRIAYCRISKENGGKLYMEVAHAEPLNMNRTRIPAIPDVIVKHAKYNSKDVKDIITRKVIDERRTIWVGNRSMEGDPAPGWQKNLNLTVSVNGKDTKLSRHEGGRLSFSDFFPKTE